MTLQVASAIIIVAAIIALIIVGILMISNAKKSRGGRPIFGILVLLAGVAAALCVIFVAMQATSVKAMLG